MARFHLLTPVAVLGFAALVSEGRAQAAPSASPILAPRTEKSSPASPDTARRTRAISPEAAAALSAAAPKYTPPPPKPEPKPEAEEVDMREVDKPKNGIVRLNPVIVRQQKPPVFRERDINTNKGLTDIAMRRYITETDRVMNAFTIPLFGTSQEKRARAMYEEDERLKNMADLDDSARTAAKFDPGAGDYIKKESQKTFMRTSDFGWNGGGPK